MDRRISESKAIERIKELDENKFIELGSKIRNKEWDYVGSMSKKTPFEAYWMRFNEDKFEMITCSDYAERYSLIQYTEMDLRVLKDCVANVIGFGDCTGNGSFDPDSDDGLASIIEAIAFSLPNYGGYNDILSNIDLLEKYPDLVFEDALMAEFKNICNNYDIPIEE